MGMDLDSHSRHGSGKLASDRWISDFIHRIFIYSFFSLAFSPRLSLFFGGSFILSPVNSLLHLEIPRETFVYGRRATILRLKVARENSFRGWK